MKKIDKRCQGSKSMARRVAFGQREAQRKAKIDQDQRIKIAIAGGDFDAAMKLISAETGDPKGEKREK